MPAIVPVCGWEPQSAVKKNANFDRFCPRTSPLVVSKAYHGCEQASTGSRHECLPIRFSRCHPLRARRLLRSRCFPGVLLQEPLHPRLPVRRSGRHRAADVPDSASAGWRQSLDRDRTRRSQCCHAGGRSSRARHRVRRDHGIGRFQDHGRWSELGNRQCRPANRQRPRTGHRSRHALHALRWHGCRRFQEHRWRPELGCRQWRPGRRSVNRRQRPRDRPWLADHFVCGHVRGSVQDDEWSGELDVHQRRALRPGSARHHRRSDCVLHRLHRRRRQCQLCQLRGFQEHGWRDKLGEDLYDPGRRG